MSLDLTNAAFNGDLDTVRSLAEAGADVNAPSEHGAGTLLTFHPKVTEYLLSKGADANLGRTESMETPLHHGLAGAGDAELIQLLIDHGADVNAKTKPGISSFNFYGSTPTRCETPLHRAAAFASIEVVDILLKAGADRTIGDVNGDSPHNWAGWHRRPKELVELLRP
jgi:ankyrin repeat protein